MQDHFTALSAPVGVAPSRRTSSPRFLTMESADKDDATYDRLGNSGLLIVKPCANEGKHAAIPIVALRRIFMATAALFYILLMCWGLLRENVMVEDEFVDTTTTIRSLDDGGANRTRRLTYRRPKNPWIFYAFDNRHHDPVYKKETYLAHHTWESLLERMS